jgi:hypothetical protein
MKYKDGRNRRDCYNGNINLKNAGVNLRLEQWQLDEIDKCREDHQYFIETYCKIIDLDKGLVNFKMFDFQKRAIQKLIDNRFSIWKWPRQSGKSVSVASILLWYALFNFDFTIAILAHKAAQAREIMARIQRMYEELPWWMQPGVKTWNKGNVLLGNHSEIFTSATTGSGVRGRTISVLYLDEFAFVENDVEFYTGTYPVVTSGTSTKIFITSTPNGMNLFYKLWTDAINKKNEYVTDEAHWYEHPKRDEAWKDQQLRNMSERQFNQEFLTEFLGSSDTLISGAKLQQLAFAEPYKTLGDNRDFKIYAEPVKGNSYVITVDVSEGVGRDYSVCTVIDCTAPPFTQVAMLRSNIMDPLLLADLVNKTGKEYNEALVIVETNSVGKQCVDALWIDYEYENVLISRTQRAENVIKGGNIKQIEYGVRTTKRTKLLGCSSLKSLIESDQLKVQDFDTIVELSSFVKRNNSYQASDGKTDDIVMTLVMFGWFASQPYFHEMVDVNVRRLVHDNLLHQDEYSVPFGFLDDGTDDSEFIQYPSSMF